MAALVENQPSHLRVLLLRILLVHLRLPPVENPTTPPTDSPVENSPIESPTNVQNLPPISAVPISDTPVTLVPNNGGGFIGDPIVLGLQNQVFKFEGVDGGWYSNLSKMITYTVDHVI